MGLSFNGSSEYLSMNAAASQVNNTLGAMYVWANIPASEYTGSGAKVLFEIGQSGSNNNSIGLRCGSGYVFAQYRSSDNNYNAGTGTTAPYEDTWSLFAAAWTSDTLYFYANGGLTSNPIGSPITATLDQVRAAADARAGASNYLQGELAGLRIYDRVPARNESETIYAIGGGDCIVAGLIGSWRCNELSPGTTVSSVPDLSIFKNNATATGSPSYVEDILKCI